MSKTASCLLAEAAALERRAKQIQNVACLIEKATAYDEALEEAQGLLAEAARVRERAAG